MRTIITSLLLFGTVSFAHAQRDIEVVLRFGELAISGYNAIVQSKNGNPKELSCCIKNKLGQSIIFRMTAKDEVTAQMIFKEVYVESNESECMLDLEARLYTYEVRMLNGDIQRKGDIIIRKKHHFTIKP